jgi:hypothetical protein
MLKDLRPECENMAGLEGISCYKTETTPGFIDDFSGQVQKSGFSILEYHDGVLYQFVAGASLRASLASHGTSG